MRIGVLLTPGYLEAEAALVLEVARLLKLESFTLARGRTALEGSAGAVWTPKYTFAARPEMDVLIVPGGPQMSKLGNDAQHRDWMQEVWPGLRAVFLGANAGLFLLEQGELRSPVAAHPLAHEALREKGIRTLDQPWSWNGKVCTTGGYLELARALLDWTGFADEARQQMGL
jgi:transcriptional regulator GlxA family with amidase domain